MIIVEYCRFGNVRDFLIEQRHHFVDQIIRQTDTIDSTIMTGKHINQSNILLYVRTFVCNYLQDNKMYYQLVTTQAQVRRLCQPIQWWRFQRDR